MGFQEARLTNQDTVVTCGIKYVQWRIILNALYRFSMGRFHRDFPKDIKERFTTVIGSFSAASYFSFTNVLYTKPGNLNARVQEIESTIP